MDFWVNRILANKKPPFLRGFWVLFLDYTIILRLLQIFWLHQQMAWSIR